jgi:hypothetical protein
MKRFLFYSILILSLGCSSTNEGKKGDPNFNNTGSFFSLDCGAMMKDYRIVPVSNFVDSLEYVVLETTVSSMLGRVFDAQFTRDYIFIEHNGPLAQFDRKGKFLRLIGKVGRGPEEYNGMRAFSVDEVQRLIYIQANWARKILVYSFEGEFVKSIDLNLDDRIIVWSRDSLFMCFSEPQIGNEEYVFREIDSEGKRIQTVKNYSTWQDKAPFGRTNIYWGRNIFYRLNNKLHFKGEFNDTVYTYDSNYKVIPKFYIDLKEYRLPANLRIERGPIHSIPPDFYWACVRETSRFIFIRYSTYAANPSDIWALDEGYIYVDKKTGVYETIHNKNDKSGFINDLDGGPDFIPEYTNDSLAFHFIKSIDMKEFISSDNFLKSTPKYPEKKELLLNKMNGLKESDNDILVIAKLK